MKTVRSQVFETNSSSTHSVSLITSNTGYRDTTIIPDENGIVHIGKESVTSGGTIHAKARFILDFAEYLNRQDDVKSWIKEFTGAREIDYTSEFRSTSWTGTIKEILTRNINVDWSTLEDQDADIIQDLGSNWYLGSGEYSDSSPSEELEKAKQIILSKEKTLDFIFKSSNGFDVSEQYDD